MGIIKNEFALALNQVAQERGIAPEEVISSIEQAIIAAYVKEYPEETGKEIIARVNRDNGEAHIFENEKDITPPGFGRIAAQTARNVVVQKIREAERKTAVSHYQAQIGTLIKGRIIRVDGYNAYIDLNRTEGILPKMEQIPGEQYAPNLSYTFLLKSIEDDKLGRPRIILSRANPEFIVQLFKREVPEIASGSVEIKSVVREPGERAKIAVWSLRGGVDPVGACVGQKGVRVQVVTEELGKLEKLDIIQWQPDVKELLTNALSPAAIESIKFDEDRKKAEVTVKVSQAPLAIGKGGVNVNLAGKLVGYEIDILQVPDDAKIEAKESSPEDNKTETENSETVTTA
ncbi:MAG: transcription termination factor NusA [Patescibacteria group bacterium]